ncbi:hypothetical protein ANO11243_038400 [Dothideomycetidae sp. 11243]|nr:hypothetical protein ANO11243_038400 [fungal sp. No.11243]
MERSLVIANTGTDRLVSSGSSEGINDTTEKKQNRVRIVEPPSENENKPKGILKKPKEQFPEDPNPLREGVAPLKDKQQSKEIPKGACWTKVSRQLVNPEALRESGERFEEREGCVIVLRVLQKEDIFVLAEKTREIRSKSDSDALFFCDSLTMDFKTDRRDRRRERDDERSARRQARHEEDEYDESSSDNEFSDRRRAPRMLEPAPTAPTSGVPPTTSAPQAAVSVAAPPPPLQQQSGPRTDDYGRDRDRDRRDRDRDRDRERDRPDRIRDRD